MTFGSTFGRVFSPTFQPKSLAPAVASSWWLAGGIAAANCIGAYQPKGAADIATSYVNLANPGTYNLTAGNAPAFDTATGWYFNRNHWLKTGIIPAANQTWSLIIDFTQTLQDYASPVGVASTNQTLYIYPYYIAGRTYWYSGTKSYINYSSDFPAGVAALAGRNCYADGSLLGTMDSGTQAGNTQDIYIGAINVNGTASQKVRAYVRSVAFYDIDISAYVGAVSTAMAAL